MELTERQRAIVAFIRTSPARPEAWDLPWDNELCDKMENGGPPLKVTGEHWEEPAASALRREARNRDLHHPTWLTAAEITERHGMITSRTTPAEVVVRGRPTLLYSVDEIAGLPEKLRRRYWEIHPVNSGQRDPGFERFLSTLDVDIRHLVEKPEEGGRLAYLYEDNAIRTPPFEMFYTAADYYFSLAHELIHWAEYVTEGVRPGPDDPDPVRARRELVAEFGAVFVCDEMGMQAEPGALRASPIDYIEDWRRVGMLNEREVLDAAQTAATRATWVCRIAPGWRSTTRGPGRPAPEGDQSSRTIRRPDDTKRPEPHLATLKAAANARRFVIAAEALGKMDPAADPAAWARRATNLLESARQIDLTIPAVEAAIEAAVALATPLDATPVTAATWLKDFQERTMRIRAMRDLTRSAGKTAETKTIRRSIKP